MTEDEMLAAELALGLLDAKDQRAAEARAAREPGFARDVEWWRELLGTLGAAPVAPPPGLWRAIALRLADNDDVGSGDVAAKRWRAATVAMTAIAAVLLGVIALRPTPVPPPPPPPGPPAQAPRPVSEPLVASLSGARGDGIAISFDRDTRALLVTPAVLKPGRGPDAGDVELWVIPVAATTPVSIGVIDARAPSRRLVDARRAALLVEGATMAVSLEPRGGSPTGAPTGPVVATGKIVRV